MLINVLRFRISFEKLVVILIDEYKKIAANTIFNKFSFAYFIIVKIPPIIAKMKAHNPPLLHESSSNIPALSPRIWSSISVLHLETPLLSPP